MCLIAFVLGYLVARMMRGNGLNVGALRIRGETNMTDEDFNSIIELCNAAKKNE
tara:strand:+ start:361 stop:522 length:162 start_codon:yes stop_codon:yes gene_type:complete